MTRIRVFFHKPNENRWTMPYAKLYRWREYSVHADGVAFDAMLGTEHLGEAETLREAKAICHAHARKQPEQLASIPRAPSLVASRRPHRHRGDCVGDGTWLTDHLVEAN